MAGLNILVPTGEVSLTAATPRTVWSAAAPANQRLRIRGFEIFGKGASPVDTPMLVEVLRITADGTAGGNFSVITPPPLDDGHTETAQGVYRSAYTTEASITYGALLASWEVHPQTGILHRPPAGDDFKVKGGGLIGLRITAPQNQTVTVNGIVDE